MGKIFRGFHGFEKIIHENKGMVHTSIFAKLFTHENFVLYGTLTHSSCPYNFKKTLFYILWIGIRNVCSMGHDNILYVVFHPIGLVLKRT